MTFCFVLKNWFIDFLQWKSWQKDILFITSSYSSNLRFSKYTLIFGYSIIEDFKIFCILYLLKYLKFFSKKMVLQIMLLRYQDKLNSQLLWTYTNISLYITCLLYIFTVNEVYCTVCCFDHPQTVTSHCLCCRYWTSVSFTNNISQAPNDMTVNPPVIAR